MAVIFYACLPAPATPGALTPQVLDEVGPAIESVLALEMRAQSTNDFTLPEHTIDAKVESDWMEEVRQRIEDSTSPDPVSFESLLLRTADDLPEIVSHCVGYTPAVLVDVHQHVRAECVYQAGALLILDLKFGVSGEAADNHYIPLGLAAVSGCGGWKRVRCSLGGFGRSWIQRGPSAPGSVGLPTT